MEIFKSDGKKRDNLMKKKIFVSAIYTSPPTSMGGNTKILIELINNLSDAYDFVIFTSEPKTFKINIKDESKIKIIDITYNYTKMNPLTHLSEIMYINKYFQDFFKEFPINRDDYFYSSSDFAPDVLPVYNLKKKYQFKWIASLFLFIPNPLENLINKYKFPFYKYILYFIYQGFLFNRILKRFDFCLITNDIDRKFFPENRQKDILSIYGGVNLDQIIEAKKENGNSCKYDAVFCSRLHQQKGISQLLNIWSIVVKKIPTAQLAIIGNGDPNYELFLRRKATKLQLDNNIDWLGYVNNVDKYKIYQNSKIFLHATIYDNNGMVAAEALCSGLPVIMYDLQSFKTIYNIGCIKVKEGDINEYANMILKLINEKMYYDQVKPDLNMIAKMNKLWDWEKRAKSFKGFIDSP